MKGFSVASFMFILSASSALAEYRVYQYIVKSRYPFSQDAGSYTVTSTLDPVSYIAYHGGKESIQADLVRSWMCKGDTAGREPCSSPLSNDLKETEVEETND